jgi:pre-rRNA-processing protein IPI1
VPHATSLLLFTTSAQTHIFPEIRVDAIRFLNLYLEYIPAAVVVGWNQSGSENGSRVLEGYLGILSAGTKFGEADGQLSFDTFHIQDSF